MSGSSSAFLPLLKPAAWAGSLSVGGAPPVGGAAIQRLLAQYCAAPVSAHRPAETRQLALTLAQIPAMLDARTLTLTPILSYVIQLVASHHEEVKRRACQILVQAAPEQPDVGLLAANVLTQDLSDPNPQVRVVAVSTLCSIPALAEAHAVAAIHLALQDAHPGVRKAGVTGAGKVWFHSPQVVTENGLIDTLYHKIQDPDPTVLTFTLQTLNYILTDEGGIVINANMTKYLVSRLAESRDVELLFILEYLEKYVSRSPTVPNEVKLLVINQLDSYCQSQNGAVFLAAAVLFYRTAQALVGRDSVPLGEAQLVSDYLQRIRPTLSKFLKPSSHLPTQDFQIQLLDFVLSLDPTIIHHLDALWPDMQIKPHKDLAPLKRKKIEALTHISHRDIAHRLCQYFLSLVQSDHALRDILIGALLQVSQSSPEATSSVLPQLRSLSEADPSLGRETIRHVRKFNLDPTSQPDGQFARNLAANVIALYEGHEEKCIVGNVLWILATFAHQIDEAPYWLEFITDEMHEDVERHHLRQSLTTCGFRCFLAHPSAVQATFGRILEQNTLPEPLNPRTRFYLNLLHQKNICAKLRV